VGSPTSSSAVADVHHSETSPHLGRITLSRVRKTVERELKLIPPEGFRLSELDGAQLPERDFVSTYYDTPDLELARSGITLRHRAEDGTRLWQLKVPHGAARIELEVAGPPARPPSELLALLAAHLRGAQPVKVARLRTRRKVLRLEGAEIVEDSVAVLDGQRVLARFRELEIELTGGDEETLRGLRKLLEGAGAQPSDLVPKLFRALGVSEAEAEPVPDETPAGRLRTALVEQGRKLLDHDPGTRLGADPENLHQMRVATRRARAFLRAARALLDRGWADDLRAELGWLGSVLGPARDLDVLVERAREDVARLGKNREPLVEFVASLEREREEVRAAVVAALSEDRYFALLDRLEGVNPRLAPPAESGTTTTTTLADLWWKEFKRTRKAFKSLGSGSTDEELHAARIRVKRARYAAELAAPELGRRGEKFVDAAKDLQDVLGEHQDSIVAEQRLLAWAGDRPSAEDDAVQRLVEQERARRKKARADWPSAWAKLERRGRKARA
jgi:CHAD domain-containing protein